MKTTDVPGNAPLDGENASSTGKTCDVQETMEQVPTPLTAGSAHEVSPPVATEGVVPRQDSVPDPAPQESRKAPFRLPPYFFVFDVESMGLHGTAFAVGWVVVETATGAEVDNGLVVGNVTDENFTNGAHPEDARWVALNVIPALAGTPECERPRDVRAKFWEAWESWRDKGAWLAADVPWPVEARFLMTMRFLGPVAPGMWGREMENPYPLIDIASFRMAKGMDPLERCDRYSIELPVHNPRADARQSARLLLEAIGPDGGVVFASDGDSYARGRRIAVSLLFRKHTDLTEMTWLSGQQWNDLADYLGSEMCDMTFVSRPTAHGSREATLPNGHVYRVRDGVVEFQPPLSDRWTTSTYNENPPSPTSTDPGRLAVHALMVENGLLPDGGRTV